MYMCVCIYIYNIYIIHIYNTINPTVLGVENQLGRFRPAPSVGGKALELDRGDARREAEIMRQLRLRRITGREIQQRNVVRMLDFSCFFLFSIKHLDFREQQKCGFDQKTRFHQQLDCEQSTQAAEIWDFIIKNAAPAAPAEAPTDHSLSGFVRREGCGPIWERMAANIRSRPMGTT